MIQWYLIYGSKNITYFLTHIYCDKHITLVVTDVAPATTYVAPVATYVTPTVTDISHLL